MKTTKNYYEEELSKILKDAYGHNPQLIIHDAYGNKTKYLDLNKDCRKALKNWLNSF